MPTLLLHLKGPMQSWGVGSKFDDRDTAPEPSKSGVLGLLCAALGIDRDDWDSLQPMTQWKMGVRIVDPGTIRSDYHTAQLQPRNPKTSTALGRRSYLADAEFYVGLESDDQDALEQAQQALKNPHWALSLGRKSFPPSSPVHLHDGVRSQSLVEALQSTTALDPTTNSAESDNTSRSTTDSPTRTSQPTDSSPDTTTINDPTLASQPDTHPQRTAPDNHPSTKAKEIILVLETDDDTHSQRWDVPTAAFSQRRYGPRRVKTEVIACNSHA